MTLYGPFKPAEVQVAEMAEADRLAKLAELAQVEARNAILEAGAMRQARQPRHIRFEHGERQDLASMRALGRRAYNAAMAARGVPPPVYAAATFLWEE